MQLNHLIIRHIEPNKQPSKYYRAICLHDCAIYGDPRVGSKYRGRSPFSVVFLRREGEHKDSVSYT